MTCIYICICVISTCRSERRSTRRSNTEKPGPRHSQAWEGSAASDLPLNLSDVAAVRLLMASGALGRPVLMFVCGEPDDLTPSLQDVAGSVVRLAGAVARRSRASTSGVHPGNQSYSDLVPEHLPAEQVYSLQLVMDAAKRLGLSVRVVDLAQNPDPSGVPAPLPTETETLPILVRGDGARLVGLENFNRSTVRRFLAFQ